MHILFDFIKGAEVAKQIMGQLLLIKGQSDK